MPFGRFLHPLHRLRPSTHPVPKDSGQSEAAMDRSRRREAPADKARHIRLQRLLPQSR